MPATSDRKTMPSSTGLSAPTSATPGAELGAQMVVNVGPETVTVAPDPGVSRLSLSSTARLRMVIAPAVPETKPLYVQLARPCAGCQVAPPSSETSTPATM